MGLEAEEGPLGGEPRLSLLTRGGPCIAISDVAPHGKGRFHEGIGHDACLSSDPAARGTDDVAGQRDTFLPDAKLPNSRGHGERVLIRPVDLVSEWRIRRQKRLRAWLLRGDGGQLLTGRPCDNFHKLNRPLHQQLFPT